MSYTVVSLSGGKDSTAMLLMMLERGEQVDEVVTCDTGKEWPQLIEHIDRLERDTGITFTRLMSEKSFDYLMFEHVMSRGKREGQRGYGWARPNARWCTKALKTSVIDAYFSKMQEDVVQCVGIAADEPKRIRDKRYPLVEYGITESQALAYCYQRGYDWGGLYEKFGRVSCWCCPLQSLKELRTLRHDFPEMWEELLDMDERSFNQFRIDYSVAQLEERFSAEDRQMSIDDLEMWRIS